MKRAALAALAVAAGAALLQDAAGAACSGRRRRAGSTPLISRFSQLFRLQLAGGDHLVDAVDRPTENSSDLTCPSVAIRFGASTLSVERPASPRPETICAIRARSRAPPATRRLQGQVTARIGIMGRIIAGGGRTRDC